MVEDEEPYEAPTMSFESFLTYDAPTPSKKKKKQSSRPLQPPVLLPSASTKSGKANGTSSKHSKPSSSSKTTSVVPQKRRKVRLNLFLRRGDGKPAFVHVSKDINYYFSR